MNGGVIVLLKENLTLKIDELTKSKQRKLFPFCTLNSFIIELNFN